MNVKRILKQSLKGLLKTCWIVGVALAVSVAVFYWKNPANQSQLELLTQSIENSNDRLATINLTLGSLSLQLDALETKVKQNYSAIEVIQLEQSKHKTQFSSLQQSSDSNDQRLKSLFNGQDAALNRLIERAYRKLKPVNTHIKGSRNIPSKTSKSKQSKPQRVVPPPFQLFDVQKRGATLLAAVAPHNATSLGQVALKRRGERFSGWKILDITPVNIRIQKGDQYITVRITS